MSQKQRNILFLLSDEHNFRFMGHAKAAEGGEKVSTPNFDKLAEQSAVFDNTYCPVPLCVPSRIAMMTGLEAQKSGAINNYSIIDPEFDTLPKMLVREGYETALVGKMHFGGNLQFHGFQHRPYGDLMGTATHQYEDDVWNDKHNADESKLNGLDAEPNIGDNIRSRTEIAGRTRIPESLICDRIIAEESLAFLRDFTSESPDHPWFLCASFSRPHYPLTSPPRFADKYSPESISQPFAPAAGASHDHPVSAFIRDGWSISEIKDDENMRARAGYFACVSYLDEIIGDFLLRLESSGLLDDTIIVYASDHGEMAGEQGTWWKSGWYEGCCRVPMMISLPEHRRGELAQSRLNTPVSTLDLVPTLVSLAGGTPAEELSGVDLSGAILGSENLADRPIYCDHINPRWGAGTEFRVMRWRNWKYVCFRDYEDLLFDLEADPCEAINMIGKAPPDVEKWLRSTVQNSIDYSSVDQHIAERQPALKRAYPLTKGDAMPNQYLLPEGKLVEAETTMMKPVIISETPESFFADWPKRS